MANSLSTIAPAQLIGKRILDTLLDEYPFLSYIGADFSDSAFTTDTPTPCRPPDTL